MQAARKDCVLSEEVAGAKLKYCAIVHIARILLNQTRILLNQTVSYPLNQTRVLLNQTVFTH